MSWQLLSHSGTSSDVLLCHCSPTGHAAEVEEEEEERNSEMSEKIYQGGEEKIERMLSELKEPENISSSVLFCTGWRSLHSSSSGICYICKTPVSPHPKILSLVPLEAKHPRMDAKF